MASTRKRTRKVKGHRRGAVYVKPYCRRPPRRKRSTYQEAKEMGW